MNKKYLPFSGRYFLEIMHLKSLSLIYYFLLVEEIVFLADVELFLLEDELLFEELQQEVFEQFEP